MKYFLFFLSLTPIFIQAQTPLEWNTAKELALKERPSRIYTEGDENRSGSSQNFKVNYYRCYWEIDPAVRYITGKVTVYYTLTTAANFIKLDLSNSLQTDAVSGSTVSGFTHTADVLTINFSNSFAKGYRDSVNITYHGVPDNTGFGSFITDVHNGVPVAWSLSEPYGSKDWWPCKNNMQEKADSIDIFIKHPSQYKSTSNGLLQSEILVDNGQKLITHYKHRYPIASYLVCFAVSNYTVFTNNINLGNTVLPLITYCYPESKTLFQNNIQPAINAMQLFHLKFGDYPFLREKYGHVQFNWGGGMEHQTNSFIVTASESLMVHELAHQWFGDKVTASGWENIWLNEGFATFCTYYYLENKSSTPTNFYRQALIRDATSLPGGSVKVYDTTNLDDIFSSRLSYNKGGFLLYMLRHKLSDSLFFKGVQTYLNTPGFAYGNATTDDFKKVMENVSGKNLERFFYQWYEKQGYPSYQINWSNLADNFVRIQINQTSSHPSVSFFETELDLKFVSGSREKIITVDSKFNGQIFLQDIGFIPDTVIVDPGAWLLSKDNSTKKIILPNAGAGVASVFPNPLQAASRLYLHDFKENVAEIKIFASNGQLIQSNSVTLINGTALINLNTARWSRGIYTATITTASEKVRVSIIK